ncbi:hypothetical protein H2201_003612 [Coniosporium apollinis]|uniref:BTB domain-containing protein n=2 Tax=Coniosporium TaxID=2810619 RepID=A0ABQ9NW50_9PEZI|nr:hypothetical protein H2199_002848 [Cladosporium sp. JES 115]KAJ9666178.1 hypothetical protein H2201_003612 [Coniosporium apollinis]
MDAPHNELMSALATLLEAGKYSDLTIVCGERRWAVHRAVICSRSGFFDGACSNRFREAETGVIDLSEDEEEAVEHMIKYFYHLDYLVKSRPSSPLPRGARSPSPRRPRKLNLALVEDPLLAQAANTTIPSHAIPLTPPDEVASRFESLSLNGKNPMTPHEMEEEADDYFSLAMPEQEADPAVPHLILHAKMYAIAEKYGIKGLKSLARSKFSTQIEQHWSSAELPETIQDVYETTVDSDRGLRDIVVQTFRAHPELARRKDIEAVVRETPGVAWDLFRVGWGMPVTA